MRYFVYSFVARSGAGVLHNLPPFFISLFYIFNNAKTMLFANLAYSYSAMDYDDWESFVFLDKNKCRADIR